MTTVAALFVDPRGCYAGVPGVELWDEARDARMYDGPHPVVAHPPCARWCMLAGMVESMHPHLKRGEDGGCFESALASVRRWGGVLEHPAHSRAWDRYQLPSPTGRQWQRGMCGGWVAEVEQIAYGHPARKKTWLYAVNTDLPSLAEAEAEAEAVVSWCGRITGASGWQGKKRLAKRARSATPPAFRDLLLEMARSVSIETRRTG